MYWRERKVKEKKKEIVWCKFLVDMPYKYSWFHSWSQTGQKSLTTAMADVRVFYKLSEDRRSVHVHRVMQEREAHRTGCDRPMVKPKSRRRTYSKRSSEIVICLIIFDVLDL